MPYAIEYGMSVKEFWEDDPDLFWAYRFSYVNRKKQKEEEMNTKCWLQGAYFCEALAVALSNAFSKQKTQYCSQPYDLNSSKESPKQKINKLDDQLKQRAKQIQELLKGKKINGK